MRSSEDEWGGVRCGEVSYAKTPWPRQLHQVALQPVAVAVSLSQSASQPVPPTRRPASQIKDLLFAQRYSHTFENLAKSSIKTIRIADTRSLC